MINKILVEADKEKITNNHIRLFAIMKTTIAKYLDNPKVDWDDMKKILFNYCNEYNKIHF
jgi:hypothetical protein